MRDKIKNPLRLEGASVILEEIRPEFFPYVIKWRNDKELNRYINQPYELTQELQEKWYGDIYLPDSSQGFMVMIHKKTGTPFGSLGWTDYDSEKRQCILGRLMLSDSRYALECLEGNIILSDYLYRHVNIIYAHVSLENKKALAWDFNLGFEENKCAWEYPSERLVNNIEQCEIFRTAEKYFEVRNSLVKKFHIKL